MRTRFSILAGVAVLAVSALAGTSSATTNPGNVFRAYVVLTDKGIQTKLFQQTYGSGGLVAVKSAARGNVVVFNVRNRGKKPHNFVVLGYKTPTLRAGRQYSFSVELLRRGGFPFKSTLDNGKSFRGIFTVS